MVVAVMVMAMRSDLFWLRRRAAAMCRLAARGLELDRRMGNAELSAKPAVQSLQKAVQRLPDNTDRTPDDHRGNQEREDWINPSHPAKQNRRAACDDGGSGERIAQHVQEDAANVYIAGESPQQGGDCAVHHNTSR